jgi:hypothetical protein
MPRELTLFGAVALFLGASPAPGATVVVPNSLATVEGNINNINPFSLATHSITDVRYQQVYDASEFSALGSQAYITAITFRPDATAGQKFASTTLSDIQINLATTSAGVDALSDTFADNPGSDDTVVVPRGALSISSDFTGPAGGPKDFDVVIPFDTPFLYTPANGNLLLDVRNYASEASTFFDAVDVDVDAVSRQFNANEVGAAQADANDSYGLVTQFTWEPVPEPSSGILLLSLLAASACAFGACRSHASPHRAAPDAHIEARQQ